MSEQQIRILFFCLGNICRSPLAEGLFRKKVAERGLSERFHIESAGTGAYHVGQPPDPGSVRVARERGLDISAQRAQQLLDHHFVEFDYLVAMDHSNRRSALRLAYADADKLLLLRDYEPDPARRGAEVPDPYGGGGDQFGLVYDIVDRCTESLLDELEAGALS
ncbi:low molecular weight protein-tyrosine-phosphatase [Bradymonas sediminis]|uniref:protein-tyrosine-phosphatase n=1 Tax=Bradymonas sediminis TaxID=1548548 RepID=A0A2Z4FQI4_9DELT|nr:low molecular weight protein-tyrosine-phosphatase [Bradymonas sediminis]AWV91287.1 low molecular weight phosphotyrosine protein phosphatase [Bradymonas sediminis]TDP73860.1 protein tyrosine phosphatase [Bradymonas sediminis]